MPEESGERTELCEDFLRKTYESSLLINAVIRVVENVPRSLRGNGSRRVVPLRQGGGATVVGSDLRSIVCWRSGVVRGGKGRINGGDQRSYNVILDDDRDKIFF